MNVSAHHRHKHPLSLKVPSSTKNRACFTNVRYDAGNNAVVAAAEGLFYLQADIWDQLILR